MRVFFLIFSEKKDSMAHISFSAFLMKATDRNKTNHIFQLSLLLSLSLPLFSSWMPRLLVASSGFFLKLILKLEKN